MNATNLKFGGQKPKHLNIVSETNKQKNTNSIEVTDRAPIQKKEWQEEGLNSTVCNSWPKIKSITSTAILKLNMQEFAYCT